MSTCDFSPVVYIVEDDAEMRQSLTFALESDGFETQCFANPDEFLKSFDRSRPGCIVLDLQLPGMTGMELHQKLIASGRCPPFIIVTGHGDVPDAVQAMRAGAIDFLQKPFDPIVFLERVREAFVFDKRSRGREMRRDEIRRLLQQLTPRESEVLDFVVAGELSKTIAKSLGISPKTVEVHRSNISKKLGVDSAAQLVRLVMEYQAESSE